MLCLEGYCNPFQSTCNFNYCWSLRKLEIPDRVERIGEGAFDWCGFTKFRCPPLINTIPDHILTRCCHMFSLELPKNTIRVERFACKDCYSLRNVALASHTVVEDAGVDHYGNLHHAFSRCLDLIHIFAWNLRCGR
jgi:hypothetical protein